MDAIEAAIKNGYHINDIPEFKDKTWGDFERDCTGKYVYLFGAGIGVESFFRKFQDKLGLIKGGGVIDNNQDMQGFPVECLSTCMPDNFFKNSHITDISVLSDVSADEYVILITSIKKYAEIALTLKQLGITNYYSLLCMEYFFRKENYNYLPLNGVSLYEIVAQKLKGYPVRPNKVYIETYYTYEGHGKSILKKLSNMRPDLDIVWVGKYRPAVSDIPNVRYITNNNVSSMMYEFATSKILLTDGIPSCWDIKKADQILIQMKHWSSITLKEFYWYEFKDRCTNDELKIEKEKYSKLDYIFVGSKFDEDTCREGFLFEGPSVYVGSPRSDVLFGKESLPIREIYNISPQTKILLYAPTFRLYEKNWKRKWKTIDVFIDLDFENIKKSLEDKTGDEWVIFLRLHPILSDQKKDFSLPKYVIDVSDYPDSEELVVVSNAMVADYSSIMFEPAFVKKPVFLLATDKDEYLRRERGFLINYETLPFPIAESNEELAKNVANFDYDSYVKKVDAFFEKYGLHEDGHASERATRFILDLLDGMVHEGKARDEVDYVVSNAIRGGDGEC
ncbi:hypothetical protein NZ47_04965 [Anaerovibrio lipolyticus]|uniref:CDP-glycerol:glycerophosphate glycerophosphotransferase n=1 Tax=Anaerovibrio lipolyticus TaxID=82374 RepID=A0A0B2JVP9_9FIRM|nr:CDP-glycerol glycerophosphotransferase family protein [Anaerovibrio lipolyticus]KHM52425.1 hypothetical protein NZ47_04965 [Anaerovibrio lipolyticus]